MNKYFLLIITILSLLISTSCKEKAKRTNELEKITIIVENAEKLINQFDANVQSAIDSRSFSYINTVYNETKKTLSTQIEQLKETQFADAAHIKLKEVAIAYLQSLNAIIDAEKEYTSLADSTTIQKAQLKDQELLKKLKEAEEKNKIYIQALNTIN